MLLALFPLQLVIFPYEEIPLHIFEPRYRQLIAECRDENITFGMPPAIGGRLSKYGTEVELVKILKTYDSGEMDIIVRGKRRFYLKEYVEEVPDKLYSAGKVQWLEEDSSYDAETQEQLVKKFRHALKLSEKEIDLGDPLPDNISYHIAPILGLPVDKKVDILSATSERERQDILLELLDQLVEHLKSVQGNELLGKLDTTDTQYFSRN